MKNKFAGGGLWNKRNSLKLQKFKENNKKRKVIVIAIILSVLLFSGIYLYNTFAVFSEEKDFNVINGTVSDPGDIYFAYYVDNKISLEPPIGNSDYTLDITNSSCTNNVTLTWNNTTKSLNINYQDYKSSGYSKTRCNLYFKKTQTLTSLVDKVKSLENKTNMTTDTFNNIRYTGSSPNNYVYFNCSDYNNPSSSTCEKWRIIGLMKDIKTFANGTKDLVKIIKNDTLESVTFGYNNNFANSQLKTTLTNVLKNDTTRNLVENVVWPLGGTSTIKSPSEMYSIERGTAVYSGNATTVTTKVGLMYPSDYGYATGGVVVNNMEVCSRTSMDKWDTYSNCANKNWLKPTGVYPELTMTQNTNYSYIMFGVGTDGILANSLTQRPDGGLNSYNNAKPVVYLSTSLNISGGTGSSSSPYILTTASQSETDTDTVASSNGKYLDSTASNCNNNVAISWNDTTNKIVLNFKNYKVNNKERTKCKLYFKKAPINIITALDNAKFATYRGTNANYGNVVAGTNPNNYIYFNCDDYNNQSDATCEKWRVLSFGPTTLQNGNTARLVKIRRAESIGKRQWSTVSDGMIFRSSSLFTYLNNTFYSDLKNSVTKNMISSNAKWYGGSIPMSQIDSIHMNDTYTYVSKNTINASFRIGLVNAYEYAYSAGDSSTDIYWCLNVDRPKYNWGVFGPHEQCAEKSWIYDSSWPQWTMTESDDPTAVIISQKGEIGNDRVIYSYNVYPVLYLDNTLKIGDGDGSSEFPYQIVP